MTKIFSYQQLEFADLIVDAVYEGDEGGKLTGEPFSRLLPGIGNLGGFRASGRGEDKRFVILYSTGADRDWPDSLDLSTGQFVYYGDNKSPGHELHDTGPGGNRILRRVFQLLHGSPEEREKIPPFLVFRKYPTATSARSIQFKGLAVPGFRGVPPTADLVAVWKTTEGQRFQNYRAIFTILDVPLIPRAWLNELYAGGSHVTAPRAWVNWHRYGRYEPLTALPTTIVRSVDAQSPQGDAKNELLMTVWDHFRHSPIAFESFAARIFQMQDARVVIDELTRASVDGGRDAVGRYLLGLPDDPVYADFSLEAKCYRPTTRESAANLVGVKEVARLISRIRHREFGVLVTTSAIARQAYEEVRKDRHPIIFLCGGDIANILVTNGYNTPELVSTLLKSEYAVEATKTSV